MLSVCKAAGRPFPTISDDDVLDYLVTEAVALRYAEQESERAKQDEKTAERKSWMKRKPGDPNPGGTKRRRGP